MHKYAIQIRNVGRKNPHNRKKRKLDDYNKLSTWETTQNPFCNFCNIIAKITIPKSNDDSSSFILSFSFSLISLFHFIDYSNILSNEYNKNSLMALNSWTEIYP